MSLRCTTRAVGAWFRGLFLPADKASPPRPDWPILRHLTYVEAHAFELGVYFMVAVVGGLELGYSGTAYMLVVLLIRRLISQREASKDNGKTDSPIALRDVAAEPVYFGFGSVIVLSAYWMLQFL